VQKKLLALASAISITLAGCASSPDEMNATYVSPLKYKSYDCDQIAMEMDYVGNETTKLYTQLKKKSSNDDTQMAVGMILFWPTLFFLEGGDGPAASQYSQMKGEFEALRKASTMKKCMNDFANSLDEEVEKRMKEKEATK
jgi:hypothetical protein